MSNSHPPSPLQAAIEGDHPDVAMQLLRCGMRLDVNARTYLGESALSLAAYEGYLSVVERLLQEGRVDPNDVDKMGCNAFWWAARAGQARVVERPLKNNRVLTQLKDENGMDALDAASHHNRVMGNFGADWALRSAVT
ncbi:ankyrin repeat-containing domain protein [Penicillium hordei]|uniref:Ankyrin repeat-containing domain protein n=1 Tax=Penicillium hordei TaxID=40994 RepID=A0AAD6ECG2_9EURO|nr:ankyrin repeat-containing domain protein [Penicillium hordei]KAJ5608446.1 ankyrin repeat-containing domain protein [Penicillium hordei]